MITGPRRPKNKEEKISRMERECISHPGHSSISCFFVPNFPVKGIIVTELLWISLSSEAFMP
jgi:hypothetical protein